MKAQRSVGTCFVDSENISKKPVHRMSGRARTLAGQEPKRAIGDPSGDSPGGDSDTLWYPRSYPWYPRSYPATACESESTTAVQRSRTFESGQAMSTLVIDEAHGTALIRKGLKAPLGLSRLSNWQLQ